MHTGLAGPAFGIPEEMFTPIMTPAIVYGSLGFATLERWECWISAT